ncbi:MAG: universal stress protein [Actinobacteria bacterium]|nr:universal stress protein [Actinomycetota bacterium]NIW28209.1 hypothetical protein [Actinomycetota bacterium]
MLDGDPLRILVPVDVSNEDLRSLEVLHHLGELEAVVLGVFVVPDQAVPAHLKEEFHDDAEARLESLVDGHPGAEGVLVFTHDRQASIDRVAEEHGCDAVLTPRTSAGIEQVLVPLRGDANLDRIAAAVAGLLAATEATATLFHAVGEGGSAEAGEALLDDATERLTAHGVERDRLDHELATEEDAQEGIVDRASGYDLVVFGETEPSLRERIIGEALSAMIDSLEVPALVVRDVG